MRRETIVMIWIGGLVLAAAIYAVGPDRFLDACFNLLGTIDDAFRTLAASLGTQLFGVARALAIAFYVVFAVLAFLAAQRGHRGIGALMVVTLVFLMLVWRPFSDYPAPVGRWVAALVLSFVGALVMTQRLLAAPSPRAAPPPWPPFPPNRTP